jgi:hypothetical protein
MTDYDKFPSDNDATRFVDVGMSVAVLSFKNNS